MAMYFAALAPASAAPPAVAIVTSEHSPDYVEAIEAIGAELARGGYTRSEYTVLAATELTALSLSSAAPRLIIALGTPAAQALARTESRIPQLFPIDAPQFRKPLQRTQNAAPASNLRRLSRSADPPAA